MMQIILKKNMMQWLEEEMWKSILLFQTNQNKQLEAQLKVTVVRDNK